MNLFKNSIPLLLTMLAWTASDGQPNRTLEQRFQEYQKNELHEKLFMHIDKSFYLAGEILWFKLYYMDGNLHKPLDLSQVAYVEVLDQNHKAVLQSKVSLSEGTGSGSLFFPVTLNSGVYRLRAYTQWMKNYSADLYFERPVTIVNSLRNLDIQPQPSNAYNIDFFPEGGNMVEGLDSRLAFRIADRSDRGVHCSGVIVNQNSDTITPFEPLKFGIGSFKFIPLPGNEYKAIIKVGDTVIIRNLPAVRQQGYTMQVENDGGLRLRVTVKTNILTAEGVDLFVHTRQIPKYSAKRAFSNGVAEFSIEKNQLGEGISHLTVFSSSGQPLCERLYFIRPEKKLVIESDISQQQLTSRNRVNISVQSKDESGSFIPADMSVSVYKVDSLTSGESSITNYLWLSSELKGNIESPGYYFLKNDAETNEAVDNLMLTHGWRRFKWQEVSKDLNAPQFIPEFRGHIVEGKVTNVRTGLPASNVVTYLSVPGRRVQLYSSRSDKNGKIRFYTNDFYGQNEVLLQTDSRSDTIYRLELTSPFSEQQSSTSLPPFDLPIKIKDPLVDHSVSVQVQNTFSGEKLKQLYSPVVDSSAFYGQPDKSYMLDNYVRFSTMEEVLREYVVEVLVRRQKENFRLMMANGEDAIFLDDPMTLFNGVPVFETNKVMQYDPLKVQKVEIIKRRYFYGPLVLNGIVNFTTYQPDPAMISGLNAVVFDYEGMQFQREFYSPVYETQEQVSSRLPDFRNVLYWSPDIKTNTQGKASISFYTSDLKGQYLVVLQGMDANGKVGEQFLSFTVN